MQHEDQKRSHDVLTLHADKTNKPYIRKRMIVITLNYVLMYFLVQFKNVTKEKLLVSCEEQDNFSTSKMIHTFLSPGWFPVITPSKIYHRELHVRNIRPRDRGVLPYASLARHRSLGAASSGDGAPQLGMAAPRPCLHNSLPAALPLNRTSHPNSNTIKSKITSITITRNQL